MKDYFLKDHCIYLVTDLDTVGEIVTGEWFLVNPSYDPKPDEIFLTMRQCAFDDVTFIDRDSVIEYLKLALEKERASNISLKSKHARELDQIERASNLKSFMNMLRDKGYELEERTICIEESIERGALLLQERPETLLNYFMEKMKRVLFDKLMKELDILIVNESFDSHIGNMVTNYVLRTSLTVFVPVRIGQVRYVGPLFEAIKRLGEGRWRL